MCSKAYFEELRLKWLFCEANAFNVAPNRTLQKAGFKYVKTHMTVPGPSTFIRPSRSGLLSVDARLSCLESRGQSAGFLELFAKDSWRNVYAGEL